MNAPSHQDAGRRTARGGAARALAYAGGLGLTLLVAPLLLRHLGVDGYGGYVTVTTLIAIVALVADGGMTIVVVRAYEPASSAERRQLMADVTALRALLGLTGATVAIGFALVAGYEPVLVLGAVLAGVGVVFTLTQQTLLVPLQVELRMATVAALEFLLRALSVTGLVVLIAVDAGVAALLAVSIPAGLLALAVNLRLVRDVVRPRRPRPRAWPGLLREALPVAMASILAALFYRLAVIITSVVSTERQTGLFSASQRVIDVVVPLASLLTSTAFPVLVRSAREAPERFVSQLGTLFEVALALGGLSCLGLVVGAEPIIAFLGGEEFADAASVLRIQGPATLATFLFTVCSAGLLATHAQRQLVICTVIGVGSVLASGIVLASALGAEGAALAMTVSEGVLAASAGLLLLRGQPQLRPRWAPVLRVAAAGAAGAGAALLPLPALLAAVAAVLAYLVVLWLVGGVPAPVGDALLRRTAR